MAALKTPDIACKRIACCCCCEEVLRRATKDQRKDGAEREGAAPPALHAQMAAAFCSRHIGGAVNYVAVSEYLNITPSIVAGGLAADNLVCAIYFASVFALAGPAVSAVQSAVASSAPAGAESSARQERGEGEAGTSSSAEAAAGTGTESDAAAVAAAGGAGAGGEYAQEERRKGAISVTFGAYSLAAAGAICAGSVAAARALGVAGADIPIITLVVVVLARMRCHSAASPLMLLLLSPQPYTQIFSPALPRSLPGAGGQMR